MLKASEFKKAVRLQSAIETSGKRASGSYQRVVGTPCEWIVTRTIRETYGAFGCTREEAVAWVNEKAPGADTVTILTESAKRVRPNKD